MGSMEDARVGAALVLARRSATYVRHQKFVWLYSVWSRGVLGTVQWEMHMSYDD